MVQVRLREQRGRVSAVASSRVITELLTTTDFSAVELHRLREVIDRPIDRPWHGKERSSNRAPAHRRQTALEHPSISSIIADLTHIIGRERRHQLLKLSRRRTARGSRVSSIGRAHEVFADALDRSGKGAAASRLVSTERLAKVLVGVVPALAVKARRRRRRAAESFSAPS